jgi:hypothetical protein
MLPWTAFVYSLIQMLSGTAFVNFLKQKLRAFASACVAAVG